MDMTSDLIGVGLGATMLLIGWRVFLRLTDSKPLDQLMSIVSRVLTGFDRTSEGLHALTERIEKTGNIHANNQAQITAVLDKLFQSMQAHNDGLGSIVSAMHGEASELDKHSAERYAGATTILGEHGRSLTEILATLGEIKGTIEAAPMMTPDAVDNLKRMLAEAIAALPTPTPPGGINVSDGKL